jgi:AraC-like DNA-binding protein
MIIMNEYNKYNEIINKMITIHETDYHEYVNYLPQYNYNDFILHEVGIQRCKPLHSQGIYPRVDFALHYVFNGKGRYNIYDKDRKTLIKEYTVTKGQAFLIYPHVNIFYQADSLEPWSYMWMCFKGSKVSDYINSAGFSENNHVYTPKHSETASAELLFKMTEEHGNIIRITGYAHLFFDELINNSMNTNKKNHKKNYMNIAVNYISQNYWKKIKITDIADICGIDRSYLCRLFKEETGYSPQEYMIKVRIDNACVLLKQNYMSVGDAARSVGYENQFTFSKQFRRIIGQSPSDYKKFMI